VAAGYLLYGTSTMLVYSTGKGVKRGEHRLEPGWMAERRV
jgi:fructose-1,6-bisphosphatase